MVPELIALCVVADGKVEDEEVELAQKFIENDDFILDKGVALQSLLSNLDVFAEERKKSTAIFKLKATTIVHKSKKITDELQKERLYVMLDGMLSILKNSHNNEDTKNIVENIKNNIKSDNLENATNQTRGVSRNGQSSFDKSKGNNSSKSNRSSLLKTGAAVAGGALIGSALAGNASAEENIPESLDNEIDNLDVNDELSLDDQDIDIDEIGDDDGGSIFDLFDD